MTEQAQEVQEVKMANPVTFSFRTKKDQETGVETKRASVVLDVPTLEVEDLISILEAPESKEYKLVFEVLNSVFEERAREILAEKEEITSSEDFPMEELSWSKIANIPPAQRGQRGISKELWEEFYAKWYSVMTGAGLAEKLVENQVAALKDKLKVFRMREDMLKGILARISQFHGLIENDPYFAPCVADLTRKANDFIQVLNAEDSIAI